MAGDMIMKVDTELVIKATKGDKIAFSDLYYSCYNDLYKFAFYTLGNADDAVDVVSDAFVEIWKGIGKLRNPGSFAPWAFKILNIQCGKVISEKVKRKQESDIDEFTEVSFGDSKKLEEDIAEAAALSAALCSLGAEERMIVILSVLYGYTYREIGEMIGKPAGTVGSKLHRTYAKLRRQLAAKK